MYDLKASEEVATYTGHKDDWLSLLAFSPDGSRVASGGVSGTVHVWNINAKGQSTILETDRNAYYSLCFTPDGKSVVARGVMELSAWDSKTGAQQELTDEHRAAFDRSQNRLVKKWVWEERGEAEEEDDEGVRKRAFQQRMMTLASAETGEAVGWLPLLKGGVTHHPSGRIWANKRADQVWIFGLEGDA